ncbi:MAG TPA: isocitrate lyase/phosphoenolpyruvate mutase family protein [Vicinamibacterales bacterium]|jgi:methylisocitrate lyase
MTPGSSTSLATGPRIAEFRRLHQTGCFVMPNPWDIGSARILVGLGFPAIATTSAGMAWSLGRRDNDISVDVALAHLRALAGCVEVPVNADFEDGFAPDPDGVAANVATAAATGVAGVSIEDSTGEKGEPLYELRVAVERIRAARRAIDDSGTGVLLTGRSEGFISGRPDLAETIKRLVAYAEAGADCLYAPGVRAPSDIAEIVGAVAPKPVNVLVGGDYLTVAQLTDLGVRRISVGGALARAAWTGFLIAAKEIALQGTFTGIGRGISVPEMNGLFGSSSRHGAC